MKKNVKKLLSLATVFLVILSFAFIFTACDMVMIDNNSLPNSTGDSAGPGGKELTSEERDELEKSGHFLKLTCMPNNTQSPNVFSVTVANSAITIGIRDKNKPVYIYKEKDSFTSSVYIPLVYNDDSDFIETGSFYTAFSIHVDAVRKYIVNLSDKLLVEYINGRGTLDVRNIPQVGPADFRYLTIFNLPSGFVSKGISDVSVHNMYNPIAFCKDYNLVEVFTSEEGLTSVKIPLYYSDSQSTFTSNGKFFVSFELYCDALSHYSISPQDRITVNFINGNGYLDIGNLQFDTIPYLEILGLPLNVTKRHFSNISVYNKTSSVASCNNNNIIILKGSSYSTALIPLTYSGTDYFRDTGAFIVTFTINIDFLTQIIYTQNDSLMLDFFEGCASFDLVATLGFFNAELLNPLDIDSPIIKKGSSFEINGYIYKITNDLEINSFLPSYSCITYIYCYRNENEVIFEYSPTTPTFNEAKKGYYNGNKRALFKMFLLSVPPSTPTGKPEYYFLAKKYIADEWTHLDYFVINNNYLIDSFSSSNPVFTLEGNNNPPPTIVTLEPGIYLVRLVGAGGGGASNLPSHSDFGNLMYWDDLSYVYYNQIHNTYYHKVGDPSDYELFGSSQVIPPSNIIPSSSYPSKVPWAQIFITLNNYTSYLPALLSTNGGDGGSIIELLFVSKETSFTAFTGSGGFPSSQSPNGIASGGGGGGSGTFLFSNQGYLLCAGGGAGAPGISCLAPAGGGGTGGSIGSGGGGGGSGYQDHLISYSDSSPSTHEYTFSNGGNGGGYQGGAGGMSSSLDNTKNGTDGVSFVPLTSNLCLTSPPSVPYSLSLDYETYGSTQNPIHTFQTSSGGSGGSAPFLTNSPIFNTNNANGQPEDTPLLDPSIIFYQLLYNFSHTYFLRYYSFANKTDKRDGGNNRNSLRGGGGDGGSKTFYALAANPLYRATIRESKGENGSITIYKIQ